MLTVLLIMAGGFLAGYLLRNKKQLIKWNNKATLWVIFLLLFFMGVSVGSNAEIMNNLDTIGLRGLELSLVAVLGSVLLSWPVYVFFFKKSNHER